MPEIPIETDVYIINKASNRKLYAQGAKNWQEGFGAGSPPSAVHADGVWRIVTVDGGGFRIVNQDSERIIYAAADGNWETKCGAGSPGNAVHSDGVWDIEEEEDGFRIINKAAERVLYAAENKNWTKKVGAGWPREEVHADGVWYIRPAQEQMSADSEQNEAASRENEPEELVHLWRACHCYAVWAVPNAEWLVGVHAPRHGSDCWNKGLNWHIPYGHTAFKGHLDIKHFGSLDDALVGYYDGAERHELFGPARLHLW